MIGSKKLSKWLARHSASVETVDDPRHTDLVIPWVPFPQGTKERLMLTLILVSWVQLELGRVPYDLFHLFFMIPLAQSGP
jgi:hypothetical protein